MTKWSLIKRKTIKADRRQKEYRSREEKGLYASKSFRRTGERK